MQLTAEASLTLFFSNKEWLVQLGHEMTHTTTPTVHKVNSSGVFFFSKLLSDDTAELIFFFHTCFVPIDSFLGCFSAFLRCGRVSPLPHLGSPLLPLHEALSVDVGGPCAAPGSGGVRTAYCSTLFLARPREGHAK